MQDTPDGSYAALEKKGKKQKANLLKELLNGFTNYRIWLLAACYAYSFGVEVCLLQTRHCCSLAFWPCFLALLYGPAFWHSFAFKHCMLVGMDWQGMVGGVVWLYDRQYPPTSLCCFVLFEFAKTSVSCHASARILHCTC